MDRRVAGERAATPAPTQLVLCSPVVLLSVACAPVRSPEPTWIGSTASS